MAILCSAKAAKRSGLTQALGLMAIIFVILLPALLVMLIYSFVLIHQLFKRLRANHPEKDMELGSQTVFRNNTARSNVRLLKFIYSGEHRALQDSWLNKTIPRMRYLLPTYVVGFIAFVAMLTRFEP